MVKLFPAGTKDRFVDLVCSGVSIWGASAAMGMAGKTGYRWWRQAGAMTLVPGVHGGLADPSPSREGPGRALSLDDRITIQGSLRRGISLGRTAEEIGRNKSIVSREVRRNLSPDGVYYATRAHTKAHQRRRRPKSFKLIENTVMCDSIAEWMDQGWSPRLISRMLAAWHPGDQTWQVSHETIYQALYVQTRGSLRADLSKQLSLARSKRVSHTASRTKSSPYREAFTISERPPEVADRAVPGHWEGDLIVGPASRSAIGTLVERTTRFVILLHLPERHTADAVADTMIKAMKDLPEHLRRSVTWDRGSELAEYRRIQLELGTTLFFADPHSPWQRGSNENTNRLLRHWFQKSTDLSIHTAADLRRVQDSLNKRPRPTLAYATPADRLKELLTAA